MDGKQWKAKRTSRLSTCKKYTCRLDRGGLDTTGADLLCFNHDSVDQFFTPPYKSRDTVAIFISGEPQTHIYKANRTKWDGYFNYSAVHTTETDGTFASFRHEIKRRLSLVKIDAYKKLKLRRPRALWFVSHCSHRWKQHSVLSGRAEYVQELTKYIDVDVYTRHDSCRKQLKGLIKKGPEPKLQSYPFYLSFESTLCKDYISEKFWKVLEGSGPTIPIALGGISIDEYNTVAPPNSFIHVKNFSSPSSLASHLRYILKRKEDFNYYHQWRSKYYLKKKDNIYTGNSSLIKYFGTFDH